jgi:hypothetical protein
MLDHGIPVGMRKGWPMMPRYDIRVAGPLDESQAEVFVGLQMSDDGASVVLSGELDQAGLHGVLERIRANDLELLGVRRLRERE